MISKLVITWLSSDSLDVFSGKAEAGLAATAASAVFAPLASQVAGAQASYETFASAKANAAAKGGKDFIAARNTAKGNLVALLRPLLSNIEGIANGNAIHLISSGFPMRKATREKIGHLSTPITPKVKPGPTEGTLKAATKAIYGASSYIARVALASAPTVYVQTVSQTSSRFQFDGLIPGELYNIEISAIGAAGGTDFSDPGGSRTL